MSASQISKVYYHYISQPASSQIPLPSQATQYTVESALWHLIALEHSLASSPPASSSSAEESTSEEALSESPEASSGESTAQSAVQTGKRPPRGSRRSHKSHSSSEAEKLLKTTVDLLLRGGLKTEKWTFGLKEERAQAEKVYEQKVQQLINQGAEWKAAVEEIRAAGEKAASVKPVAVPRGRPDRLPKAVITN